MSFWELSTGESATDGGNSYEVEGGGFLLLPDGAHVLAVIDSASWAKTQDDMHEYLKITWSVAKPEEFDGAKFPQKLWVADLDPAAASREKAQAKRDKARRMLAAIDANAGGKLARLAEKPTDDQLASALVGKMMVVGVKVWSLKGDNGDDITGNWVYFIGDKKSVLKAGKAHTPSNSGGSSRSSGGSSYANDLDDEIPF